MNAVAEQGQLQATDADARINPLAFPRRHPDLFTREEAAAYLGLRSVRSLETLRKDFGLVGHTPAGGGMIYHKKDLDACARKMCGLPAEEEKREASAGKRGKP